MHRNYAQVTTRFLRPGERFINSQEMEMPLVIEAKTQKECAFLHEFLANNAQNILEDLAHFGAVLLRGFNIDSDQAFEKTILSIPQFHGIKEAFMAENGRTRVEDTNYVLHTNSVYKTGGTLYLGGFHTENYYSADVPEFIFFYCSKPSPLGGETGLINTQKVYQTLSQDLQQQLEKSSFFVSKWLVSEVAERYQLDLKTVEKIATEFNLPLVGEGEERFIVMHKPSVFTHPLTLEKALQINLFELPTLNHYLRTLFKNDYQGEAWFWHRFFWSLPAFMFNAIESIAVPLIAFFHSPKNAFKIMNNKLRGLLADKKSKVPTPPKVGSCFCEKDVKQLAKAMRDNYCSCIWQKGDILLVDNRKVMHAGMPGKGDRVIRAMIANPVAMSYSNQEKGIQPVEERHSACVGESLVAALQTSAYQPKNPSALNSNPTLQ